MSEPRQNWPTGPDYKIVFPLANGEYPRSPCQCRKHDPAPVDWPARFRAAAEAAGPGLNAWWHLHRLAAHLEDMPPHVVEAIGRALTGGES